VERIGNLAHDSQLRHWQPEREVTFFEGDESFQQEVRI
jgi:hypothetical protein